MGPLVVTNVINDSFASGERMGVHTHTHRQVGGGVPVAEESVNERTYV